MARPDILLLFLLLIATISVVALAQQDCVYTIRIKTGTRKNAGTDSVIEGYIGERTGDFIRIKDLEKWGVMGQGHDYYENGNLDIFIGRERCLPSPVCFWSMYSDGSGDKAGWYVEYVDVDVTTGSESTHRNFSVEQWLATDEEPYDLFVIKNMCPWRVGSEIGKSLFNRMNQ